MDAKRIEFIVCSNNERALQECAFYIGKLNVPDGYEIGLLSILDGKSITSAYNEAMMASNAKYKVYLHQDVFIFNQNFIRDILEIFGSDETIGMIGVLGGVDLPINGVFFSAWNIGRTKANNIFRSYDLNMNPSARYVPVQAIDGMIMITQYDIPWREDLFTGWDFYDASQSFEFYRHGYQVVVPYQKEAWCMHDLGHVNLKNYDFFREIFLKEYLTEGMEIKINDETVSQPETIESVEKMRDRFVALIDSGNIEPVNEMIKEVPDYLFCITDFKIMRAIFLIHDLEKNDDERDYTMFVDNGICWVDLRTLYIEICYVLRRIEMGYIDDGHVMDLIEMYRKKSISKLALFVIAQNVLFDGEKVISVFLS